MKEGCGCLILLIFAGLFFVCYMLDPYTHCGDNLEKILRKKQPVSNATVERCEKATDAKHPAHCFVRMLDDDGQYRTLVYSVQCGLGGVVQEYWEYSEP